VKRVLLDACVPHRLRAGLLRFDVRTAQHAGLDALSDVELLREAEIGYDVLVTLDQAMPKQQNWAGRRLAVIVLRLAQQSPHAFDAKIERVALAIEAAGPGQVLVIDA
jgi:predicted nuclease of predicted toxin-antitoxin system